MGLFNNWPPIRRIVQLVIIQLFCWLACSVSFCFAQLSEGFTGSVNFPSSLAITCVGNLAVFVATLIRGRLDLEIGARDALGILLGQELTVLKDRNDRYALTTRETDLRGVDVVMLSNGRPNSSVREFMKSRAHIVHSVLIQFRLFNACRGHSCSCIIFWTNQQIKRLLAVRMPGILKELPEECLLPCQECLSNDCHHCNRDMLHPEGNDGLTTGDRAASDVVYTLLQHDNVVNSIRTGEPYCICIPLNDWKSDRWTELLMMSFRSKDAEGRGVKVNASEVLESYLAAGGRERKEGTVEYSIASFIVPRLTEVLINIVLTVLFKVDGFSSSLVARRTVRDYIVDRKGSGFAANAFLTKALVECDANNTVQFLSFRGNVVGIRTVSLTAGCINLFCSIVWAVLIAFDGGADTSPSRLRVVVIYAAILIAWAMNYRMLSPIYTQFMTYVRRPWSISGIYQSIHSQFMTYVCSPWSIPRIYQYLFITAICTETMCLVSFFIVLQILGAEGFGNWLYSAVQILVFLKWMAGCYILDGETWRQFHGWTSPSTRDFLPYSSAFLLNGALAGVRATWDPWPWKDIHLLSRKHLR